MVLEIYAVNLDHIIDEGLFDQLLSAVSEKKRGKIRRFCKYEDAQRALIGDILTRYLICRKLNIKNRHLMFDENEYGKPFLVNDCTIEYNISHSGRWVACCIDRLPAGIDVEQIKPIDIGIAGRFFSKREFKELMQKGENEREAFFYELWTLKESYIKAVGMGLSIPLDSFELFIDRDHSITAEPKNRMGQYHFRQYDIDEGYKMAVCSANEKMCSEVEIIDMDDLCEEFIFWTKL